MSRRPFGIQILVTVGVVGLFLFGLYQYNDVQTRLKRSSDKNEKLIQDQESMSGQLRVVLDENAKLKKAVKHTEEELSKTKTAMQDEKKELETKLTREKLVVQERVSALTSENKRLQSLHDDLQSEVSKLKEKLTQIEEDKAKAQEQYKQEYMQLKQERENEVAQLKDRVADLDRRNEQLKVKQTKNLAGNGDENKKDDNEHGKPGGRHRVHRNQHDTGNNDDHENGGIPQIKKPDEDKPKGYFDVKAAKRDNNVPQDNPENNQEHNQENNEDNGDVADPEEEPDKERDKEHQQQQQMQVAPPKVNEKNAKHDTAGTGGEAAPAAGLPGGLVGNKLNLGKGQGLETGVKGPRESNENGIPGRNRNDHANPNDHGNLNDHGNSNGIPGGHNAGVGGQDFADKKVIAGRFGSNGVGLMQQRNEEVQRLQGDSVRGAGGADNHQAAQIALPQVQQKPPVGLDAHHDDANDKNEADDENNDEGDVEGGEGVGRGGEGVAREGKDEKEDYEYEKEAGKKEHEQDRRGPNAAPVDV